MVSNPTQFFGRLGALAAASALTLSVQMLPAAAQENTANWNYGLEIYGWLPDIEGTTTSGAEIDISIDDILDNLEFTLQGTFTATRGNWSIFADGVYLGLNLTDGVSATEPIGDFGEFDLDIDAEIDLAAFVSTFGGGYKFYDEQNTKLTAVGGLRYLYMDVDVDVDIEQGIRAGIGDREFAAAASEQLSIDESGSNWDVIVGLQGETKLDDRWTLLYYGDIGTGDSDYTWQASVGIRYALENFDLTLRYRYLDYEFDDHDAFDDLTVSGPQVGIAFKW